MTAINDLITIYKDCIEKHKEIVETSTNHILVSFSESTIETLQVVVNDLEEIKG